MKNPKDAGVSFPVIKDPDLKALFPMALSRISLDCTRILDLLAERNHEQAGFLAYKLHGIVTLFQMPAFSELLDNAIERIHARDYSAAMLIEDLSARAREMLDNIDLMTD